MNITKKIETERLVLVPVSLNYAEEINRGLTEEITKYMFPKPAPLEKTIAWIKGAMVKNESGKDLTVVILDKVTGEFIGGGGINDIDTKTPEFGIWTKESSHGNYFGREAIEGLKKWADENLEYDYLKYPAHPENIPSRKIAESLGGKVEGEEYIIQDINGDDLPIVEYRIRKGA